MHRTVHSTLALAISSAISLAGCGADSAPAEFEPHEAVLETEIESLGTVRFRVWLPDGVSSGARVWLAHEGFIGAPLARADGTFGAGGRTTNLCALTGCTIELVAASSCLELRFDDTSYCTGGDVCALLDGAYEACPIEADASRANVSVGQGFEDPDAIAPVGTLLVRSAVPLDVATLDSVIVRHDGEQVPATFAGNAFRGELRLGRPIDPRGTIEIVRDGVRDVLGREVVAPAPGVLVTHAVLTDRTFDEAPPDGAIAWVGHELEVRDGALRMRDEGRYPRAPFAAVIALGELENATVVELDAEQASRPTSGGIATAITARVVRAGGGRSDAIPLPAERGAIELAIPRGEGAVWLVLHGSQQFHQPLDIFAPDVFAVHAIDVR